MGKKTWSEFYEQMQSGVAKPQYKTIDQLQKEFGAGKYANKSTSTTPSPFQSPSPQKQVLQQSPAPSIPQQKQESPESGPYGSTKVEPIPSASASKKMTVEEVKNIGDRIANTPNKLKALYDLALLVKYGKGS